MPRTPVKWQTGSDHSAAAVVKVKARPKAQRIEVCIERANWCRCFSIKITDGNLPDEYLGDAQIEDAFKLVRANYDKWTRS